MKKKDWNIYLGEIPYSEKKPFWASFESDPRLKKTRADIYGRCLPCIQNLYEQLKAGKNEIDLGNAYGCWKITAVLNGIEQCFSLLMQFQTHVSEGHVYGKIGSGRADFSTRVVVFHTQDEMDRDRILKIVNRCLQEMDIDAGAMISRGCASLYEVILGDWRDWRRATPIRFPERVGEHLEYIKKVLHWSAM
jgi:hypothetical protein